jgi:hypothetical protein
MQSRSIASTVALVRRATVLPLAGAVKRCQPGSVISANCQNENIIFTLPPHASNEHQALEWKAKRRNKICGKDGDVERTGMWKGQGCGKDKTDGCDHAFFVLSIFRY